MHPSDGGILDQFDKYTGLIRCSTSSSGRPPGDRLVVELGTAFALWVGPTAGVADVQRTRVHIPLPCNSLRQEDLYLLHPAGHALEKIRTSTARSSRLSAPPDHIGVYSLPWSRWCEGSIIKGDDRHMALWCCVDPAVIHVGPPLGADCVARW